MVSLVMVMFDELVDELAYMSLAKRDHATETLLFDRADEPHLGSAGCPHPRLPLGVAQRHDLLRIDIRHEGWVVEVFLTVPVAKVHTSRVSVGMWCGVVALDRYHSLIDSQTVG